MRYKEIPQLYCGHCNKEIPSHKNGRIRRSDTRFCSQKCHDKQKHINTTSSQKKFKEEHGLNLYTQKGTERKLQLIDLFGGKCEKCGYNKNLAAFDFHHKDPYDKNFEVKIQKLNYLKEEDILEEAMKCMLLCANCHRELNNPFMDIKHVRNVLSITKNK